jgi:hypothetical protein
MAIYEVNRPMVSAELFDGETVIIHFDTGNYYSLDAFGSIVWQAIEQRLDLDTLTEILKNHLATSEETVSARVEKTVRELIKEELVRPGTTSADSDPAEKLDLSSLEPGKLSDDAGALVKFDDLQEMLLMDPIHDVDEAGWPHVRESEN